MVPRLVSARHIADYRIYVRFADGTEGEIDLWGEVFEPLRDLEQFKRFRVDDELDTIVWPIGADLAPEFLYESVCA